MQNDRAKFKKEFKTRVYEFILQLIKFIDSLPGDRTCDVKSQLMKVNFG